MQIPDIAAIVPKHMNKEHICITCPMAKFAKLPFCLSNSKAQKPFELIHIDIWGPYRVQTRQKHKYFLAILDDYSRTVWTYLLQHKSQSSSVIKTFSNLVQTQFNTKIQTLRSDNALEFDGPCLSFFHAQGITHQTTCVKRSQQNGRVERKHRHILDMARALRIQANLPLKYWGDCVLAATYLINRTPTPTLDDKTPFETLLLSPPSYDHLRVFGCLAFAVNPNLDTDKFKYRGVPCVFIRYPSF